MFILPPVEEVAYESKLLPTIALFHLVPLVANPERLAGIDHWVKETSQRLDSQARLDYTLISGLIYRALARLPFTEAHLEDADEMLAFLGALDADLIREEVLRERLGQNGQDAASEINLDAPPLGQAVEGLDEAIRPRALSLLQQPEALKSLLVARLSKLWHQHLRPSWQQARPSLEQSAASARRHFRAGSPEKVFQAITGRPVPDFVRNDLHLFQRIIFIPVFYLGPYLTFMRRPDTPYLRVGFGVGIQPADDETSETLPGGLLSALEAMSDETRLQILARIRDQGRGCAQDLISEFGISQPVASRHLRLLETVGLLTVERIDGIKWYQINPARARRISDTVRSFLLGHGSDAGNQS